MNGELKKNACKITHGHTIGHHYTPTYRSWIAMRTRCRRTDSHNAASYVGAGISVCARWDSFSNFLQDMGDRPDGETLDRIDTEKGYEPGNCRWATLREQARNRRNAVLTLESATEVAILRLSGVPCRELSQKFGISESLPREIVKGRCWPDALELAKAAIKESGHVHQ